MEPNTLPQKRSASELRTIAVDILNLYENKLDVQRIVDKSPNPFMSLVNIAAESGLGGNLNLGEQAEMLQYLVEEYEKVYPGKPVTQYFTFGDNHMYPLGHYAEITAFTSERCREIMNQLFNNKWAFQYPAIEDQIKEYDLRCAVRICDTQLGLLIQTLVIRNDKHDYTIRTDI